MTVCTTVTVPLRLKRSERRHLATMIAEQRQAYNFGVAATLAALERDHKTGSRFDVWRTSTEARRSGLVASDVPVARQRAGASAGRDAVKLWQETIKTNMGKVAYWAARRDLCRTRNADTAQLAELTAEHGAVPQDAAVVELMDRLRVRIADAKDAATAAGVEHRKTDPVEEHKRCDTKLSAAGGCCSRHLASGTRRLFRTRKELERDPRRLHALTYHQGAILDAQCLVGSLGGLALSVHQLVAALGPLLHRVHRAPEPAPLQQQTVSGTRLVAELRQRRGVVARTRDPLTAIVRPQCILHPSVVCLGLYLPVTPDAALHTTRQAPQRDTHGRAVLDHIGAEIGFVARSDHAINYSFTVRQSAKIGGHSGI